METQIVKILSSEEVLVACRDFVLKENAALKFLSGRFNNQVSGVTLSFKTPTSPIWIGEKIPPVKFRKAKPAAAFFWENETLQIKNSLFWSNGGQVCVDNRIHLEGLMPGQDHWIYLLTDQTVRLAATFTQVDETARTILLGGFHVDLSGKIIPYSFWDLNWRPTASPNGMTLVDNKFWVDIYLMNRYGQSRSSVEIADGYEKLPHGHKNLNHQTATDILKSAGKELLSREEFELFAEGVEEGLTTKTQQLLTAHFPGLRSKWGGEQVTGTIYQWLRDKNGKYPYAAGGGWCSSGYAGRQYFVNYDAGYSDFGVAARGRCDHLILE